MCFFKMPSAPAQPQYVQAPIQQAAPTPAPTPTPPPSTTPTTANTQAAAATTQTGGTTTVIQKETPPPQEQDKPVGDAKARERRMRNARQAENNTLITGGTGITTDATTANKQLLGA